MQRISLELGDLLNDPAIVKVDVDSLRDNRFLKSDYNQKVESTLDLWHLVDRCGVSGPYEMAKLAEKKLGVKLDKYWRIRTSNWENTQLSERQIRCAASDAHINIYQPKTWLTTAIGELECFFNQRFRDRFVGSGNSKNQGKTNTLDVSIDTKRTIATRAKPLYDNYLMQA
ncbi:exonuclease 3'-5' domain-containing protein 2-like [Aedes albopictus]|uniref:3'-5' exonuclease domain-containing protein n=1 Tax=Aedes albopictus TaxID=7160 RepID=A0ABM2A3P3_AEDAL